jgi:hypothetical protein
MSKILAKILSKRRLLSLFALSWLYFNHVIMNETVQIIKEPILIMGTRITIIFKFLEFVRVKIWALLWRLAMIASTWLRLEFYFLFLELVTLWFVVLIRSKGFSYFSKCARLRKFFAFKPACWDFFNLRS